MWIRRTLSHVKTNVEQALTLQAATCTKRHLRRLLRPRHESLEFETRQAELLTRLTSASICREPGQAKFDQPSQLVSLRREDNSCQRLTDFQTRGQRGCATLAMRDPSFKRNVYVFGCPGTQAGVAGAKAARHFPSPRRCSLLGTLQDQAVVKEGLHTALPKSISQPQCSRVVWD